jgi:hypothetical protein
MEWRGLQEGRPQFFVKLLQEYIDSVDSPFPIDKSFKFKNEDLGLWLATRVRRYKVNGVIDEYLIPFNLNLNSVIKEEKTSAVDKKWLIVWSELKKAIDSGDLKIPIEYDCSCENETLRKWLHTQIQKNKKNTLKPLYVDKLNELNINLNETFLPSLPEMHWNKKFRLFIEYLATTDSNNPISKKLTFKSENIGEWIDLQIRYFKAGTMSIRHKLKFEENNVKIEDIKITT